MNTSLRSFSKSHEYVAPFIAFGVQTGTKRVSLHDFQLSCFGFPFLTFSRRCKLNLASTRFNGFLHRAISTQSRTLTGKTLNEMIEENVEELICQDCHFINCINPSYNGGSVYLSVEAAFKDCTWLNCAADEGGSIYSSSQLVLDHCTFTNVSANKCGVMKLEGSDILTIKDTTFILPSAEHFTLFMKHEGTNHTLKNFNVTRSKASDYGCVEFGCNVEVSDGVFMNNVEIGTKLCLSLWNSEKFKITETLFQNITHATDEKSGVAIWLDGNKCSGTIDECKFFDVTSKGFAYPIYVADCDFVMVKRCIFSNKRKDACNIHKGLYMDITNLFETKKAKNQKKVIYAEQPKQRTVTYYQKQPVYVPFFISPAPYVLVLAVFVYIISQITGQRRNSKKALWT